jgi:GNAT superfamily N-acetyltransferase
MTVVRAAEDQWRDVSCVRLAALRDSPSAFGSTLERELRYDETRWREWVRGAAVFLAVPSGADAPVGIAVGIPGENVTARQLVAMWVSPRWRGRGTAALLLGSVAHWAHADGGRSLGLWVTIGNAPAQRLYDRHGYKPTGRVKPLPSNPQLAEEERVLSLDGVAGVGDSRAPLPLRGEP